MYDIYYIEKIADNLGIKIKKNYGKIYLTRIIGNQNGIYYMEKVRNPIYTKR